MKVWTAAKVKQDKPRCEDHALGAQSFDPAESRKLEHHDTQGSPDLLALLRCEGNRFLQCSFAAIAAGVYQSCALHIQGKSRPLTQMASMHMLALHTDRVCL